MSLIKIYTINCDMRVEGCRGWVGQEDTPGEAKRAASRAHWRWFPGRGLEGRYACPNCAGKQDQWPT